MKTIILFIFTTLIATAGFAKIPNTASIESIKKNTISYPNKAIENQIEGVVYVEFMKNTNNAIEVLSCFSLEGELQSYVFTNLDKMNIVPEGITPGEKYAMRIDFIIIE